MEKSMTGFLDSVLPSAATGTGTLAGAVAGFSVAGPAGALVGSAAGYALSTSAVNTAYSAIKYVSNGSRTIYQSAKDVASTWRDACCGVIHVAITSLPVWIVDSLEKADWVKNANKSADEAYLQACRTQTVDGKSTNIEKLFTPIADGVAAQNKVIEALKAQAIANGQKVDKQISQWVALGERIIAELTNNTASKVRDGAVVVKSSDGQDIYVASSVYTTRAIMWYFAAQAVWGKLGSRKAATSGDYKPNAADRQEIAADSYREPFVFPDQHGRVYTFLTNAHTIYSDKVNLLCQDSMLQGGDSVVRNEASSMTLPAMDDTSLYLPGGARRVAFNAKNPAGQEQQLVCRLEELSNPTLYGQRAQGHEPLLWNISQMMLALPRKIVAATSSLQEAPTLMLKTSTEQQQHAIHTKMIEMLQNVKFGDATWWVNRAQVFEEIKKRPLHEILPYLVNPEHAGAYKTTLGVLHDLSKVELNQLKVMVYRALLEEVQAGQNNHLHQRGNENILMPHMVGKSEVKRYWRTEIARFEANIFAACFSSLEKLAQAIYSQEGGFWKAVRVGKWFIGGDGRTMETIIEQRKADEHALFLQAYLLNLDAAAQERSAKSTKPVIASVTIDTFSVEEIEKEIEDIKLAKEVDEFVKVEKREEAVPTVTTFAPAESLQPGKRVAENQLRQHFDLSSLLREKYAGDVGSAA
jgi:hypothetical protein